METPKVEQNAPEVPYVLEIHPALVKITADGDPVHDNVLTGTLNDLMNIMQRLGVPGRPTLQILPFREPPTKSDELLRFSVHGKYCSYSDDTLIRAWSCTTGLPYGWNKVTPADMLSQLQSLTETPLEQQSKVFYDFLGYFCLEVLYKRPSLLLDIAQVEFYLEQLVPHLTEKPASLNAVGLLPLLQVVLDCKISLADISTAAKVLSSTGEQAAEVVGEGLIAKLLIPPQAQSEYVNIFISRDYLYHLTTLDLEKGADKLVELRSSLWREIGVTYPSFRFILDDKMFPSPRFAFQINHFTTAPWIGLKEANDQTNELTYFILCFWNVLRENSHCFLHLQFVQEQLQRQKRVYPELVNAVYAKGITPEYITQMMREVALAKHSIKDMRLILERMLDYAYLADDLTSNAALDMPFTANGKVDASWFRDPMHVVDYVKDSLSLYSD